MSYVIAGLGNPGEEYERTRHNAGRLVVSALRKKNGFPEWKADKKTRSLRSEGEIGDKKSYLLLPETFMNKSGAALAPLITSKKKAEQLIVVHDDLDLPLGRLKISFGRNSGGHKGVESVIRAVKTTDFIRLRIGVVPHTPSGKIKKPKGEKLVNNFVVGKFSSREEEEFKKMIKRGVEAVEAILLEGKERAMGEFNS
jgi:peptidyl-tRNA hydrolase, PTH1 family